MKKLASSAHVLTAFLFTLIAALVVIVVTFVILETRP